jgi:hypothetical protein
MYEKRNVLSPEPPSFFHLFVVKASVGGVIFCLRVVCFKRVNRHGLLYN